MQCVTPCVPFQKWESVKLLFMKTEKSVALPVFSSFISMDEKDRLSVQKLRSKVRGAVGWGAEPGRRRPPGEGHLTPWPWVLEIVLVACTFGLVGLRLYLRLVLYYR